MKITFDLTVHEAQQVLRCCELGRMAVLLNNSSPVVDLSPIVDDLGKVLIEMMDRDISGGPTGPPLHPRTKKVYLEE